ncbi:hypothetical protein [Cronobacter phage vB_Cdu_VP8]|nr:hypothetical protein [Cronobacter phage vB_Cdu_VP8]
MIIYSTLLGMWTLGNAPQLSNLPGAIGLPIYKADRKLIFHSDFVLDRDETGMMTLIKSRLTFNKSPLMFDSLVEFNKFRLFIYEQAGAIPDSIKLDENKKQIYRHACISKITDFSDYEEAIKLMQIRTL